MKTFVVVQKKNTDLKSKLKIDGNAVKKQRNTVKTLLACHGTFESEKREFNEYGENEA